MEKLTKEERLVIYKRALELIKNHEEKGFCWAIELSFDDVWLDWGHPKNPRGFFRAKKNFPELLKYKPELTHNDAYWFPIDDNGRGTRINILEKIISEMESQKPQ